MAKAPGDRVMLRATNGITVSNAPSARFDAPDAPRSRWNGRTRCTEASQPISEHVVGPRVTVTPLIHDGLVRTDVRITERIDSALMVAEWSAHDIADEVDGLAAPQLADLVPALASTISRFEAVRLTALRAADRARVCDLGGMADTASWAAAATGEKRGKARSDVELADKLADLGAIASALADGRVSKSQASALAGAHAPSKDEQAELLDAAASLSLPELERRIERFNLDRDRPADERVMPAVTITPTRSGVKIDGTLDAPRWRDRDHRPRCGGGQAQFRTRAPDVPSGALLG